MKSAKTSRSTLQILNGVIIAGLIAFGGFFFYKYQQVKEDAPKSQEQIVNELIKEVGKIYELPTGETPEVATIQDVDKLSGQAFFERAQEGDKLLIYQEAKQAFLYRESTKKVINAGPVAVSEQSEGLESVSTPSQDTTEQKEETEAAVPAAEGAKITLAAKTDSLVELSNQLSSTLAGGDISTITNSTVTSNRILVINSSFAELASDIQAELGPTYEIDTNPSDSEKLEPADIIVFSTN